MDQTEAEQAIAQSHVDATSVDAQIASLRKELGVTPQDIQQDDQQVAMQPENQKKQGMEVYNQLKEHDSALSNPNFTQSVKNLAGGFGKGVLKFGEDIVDSTMDLADWASKKMTGTALMNSPHKEYVGWDMAKAPAEEQVGMMLGRYAAPLIATAPAASAMGFVGAAHTAASSVGAAVATAAAMDPQDKNLADLLESFPALHGYIPDFLTTKPDDSMAAKRLKTGVLSLVGDAAMLTTGKALTSFFNTYKARNAIQSLSKVAQQVVPDAVAGAEGVANAAPKVAPIVEEITAEQKAAHAKVSEHFNVETPTPAQMERAKMSENPQQLMEDIGLDKQPEYAAAFNELKRGVVSTEEVTAKATAIANDQGRMDKLFTREPGTPVNAEELVAMLMHTQTEFEKLSKLIPADGVLKDTADVAIFNNQLAKFRALAGPTFAGSSEAGRVQRFFQDSFKAAGTESKQIKLMDEYVRLSGGNTKEVAYFMKKAIDNGATSEKIAASFAKKGATHKGADIFWEHFINGLFGVKTNVVNTTANTAMMVGKPMETLVASGLSGQDGVYAREAYAMVHGYIESFQEAASKAGKAFFTEKFPEGAHGKWVGAKDRATSMAGGEAFSNADGFMANLVNTYGYIMTTPSRALEASDLFFGVMAKRASLQAAVYAYGA
jgi:hypothetical protein